MLKVFFLLFLLIPLTELFVLIEVGSEIGALPTILLTIATAVVGAYLMRTQGVQTMQRAQQSLAAGQVPETEMMEGTFIFLGGLLLFIPGFITDAIGFLFLIPPVRHAMVKSLIKQRAEMYRRQHGDVYETEWTEKSDDGQTIQHVRVVQHRQDNDVIEGEIVDDKKPK